MIIPGQPGNNSINFRGGSVFFYSLRNIQWIHTCKADCIDSVFLHGLLNCTIIYCPIIQRRYFRITWKLVLSYSSPVRQSRFITPHYYPLLRPYVLLYGAGSSLDTFFAVTMIERTKMLQDAGSRISFERGAHAIAIAVAISSIQNPTPFG